MRRTTLSPIPNPFGGLVRGRCGRVDCVASYGYGEMSRRSGEAAKADNHSDISPYIWNQRVASGQTSDDRTSPAIAYLFDITCESNGLRAARPARARPGQTPVQEWVAYGSRAYSARAP